MAVSCKLRHNSTNVCKNERDSEQLTGGQLLRRVFVSQTKTQRKTKKYNPNKESKYSKVYKIDKRKLEKKLV